MLGVLDCAVLVISAVEGVQAQTQVLMRALKRLKIPTLIFVNKIDRSGARYESVLEEIARRLTPKIIAMDDTHESGTANAEFSTFGESDSEFISILSELLADRNDEILNAYLDGETRIPLNELQLELANQVKQALVHPVFFRSAVTAAGVDHRANDCIVTMTHSIRHRDWVTSTAGDHRNLKPLVIMSALKKGRHRGMRAHSQLLPGDSGRYSETGSVTPCQSSRAAAGTGDEELGLPATG